jgi:hypothetical protein
MLFEQVAQLANGAVLVVGERIDNERSATGPVALVLRLLVRHARLFARPAPNRALDILGRHVVLLGLGDDGSESRVAVGIAPTGAGGNRQLLDNAGENLAALGVGRTLFMLD